MDSYEKQEKMLWYLQILIFAGAFLVYWQIGGDQKLVQIILAVLSVLSLTLDRFYFSAKIRQDVYPSYSVAYGLIVLYAILLLAQFVGIIQLPFFEGKRGYLLWVLTPAFSLLWKTKFIAFREWDQEG